MSWASTSPLCHAHSHIPSPPRYTPSQHSQALLPHHWCPYVSDPLSPYQLPKDSPALAQESLPCIQRGDVSRSSSHTGNMSTSPHTHTYLHIEEMPPSPAQAPLSPTHTQYYLPVSIPSGPAPPSMPMRLLCKTTWPRQHNRNHYEYSQQTFLGVKAAVPVVVSTHRLVLLRRLDCLQALVPSPLCHLSRGECHQGKHLPHRREKENSPKARYSAPFQWSKCSFINHLRHVSKPLSSLTECTGHSHGACRSPVLPEQQAAGSRFAHCLCVCG